ncbi:hypothetical protein PoB_001768900 [Plakobranchus ocellatus]|uniref:Uncharacterized protein n=1 Tax=Plakobranchus ocellatus TaxID=259542 RepID=A0AAV3Z779_9GAST|nr:hypothetical protein PoB_001768900 [Plakobranchus ocellatus]
MDQSAIHHPLEGLKQAAHEHNGPIVGRVRRRILEYEPPTPPSKMGMSPMVQMLLKRLRRLCRQDSGRATTADYDRFSSSFIEPRYPLSRTIYCLAGHPWGTGPPQACIPAGPQQPTMIDSAVASLNHGIHYHGLFTAWQATLGERCWLRSKLGLDGTSKSS